MATTINYLDWAEPILPVKRNSQWESQVKKQMGQVPDLLTRVSESPWLREVLLKGLRAKIHIFPRRLADIGTLVCAQENACRFCYGISRSQMKIFGYSDRMISGIEKDMLMAELDRKDHAFIRFCRSLARSNPRPSKADRDKLLELGFSKLEVSEMAFHIARECFINRVVTFISSPPMHRFEKLATSLVGRLLRPLIARKLRAYAWSGSESVTEYTGPFSPVINALEGIPTAAVFREALEEAFSSSVLSKELTVLMFAVVARSLSCKFCHDATAAMAMELGFGEDEFEEAIATLTSPRLNSKEQRILAWTRETVHYQTGPIQKRTKELAQQTDDKELLEAIGIAALANSVVRLGVLLE